ncbi:hypothetical protein [Streptomyces sp. NPDC002324]
MDIAGIEQRLIGWQSTRRRRIEDALPGFTAKDEERQGHPPGEWAAYALGRRPRTRRARRSARSCCR